MKIVMKFGGTSINSPGKMFRAARIVANRVKSNDSVVVVVSALAGVTDNLILAAEKSINDLDSAKKIVNSILLKHLNVINGLSSQGLKKSLENRIKLNIHKLNSILVNLLGMENIPLNILDIVMSFGERLSTPIFSAYLSELSINSKPLNGWEAGIITDENYGNAHPIATVNKLIRERLEPMLRSGIVPVVTGFIGLSINGKITTLGRGGSDYTASLIASSLMVDELWLWTDTDGLMTADPKIVPKAKPIRSMSYVKAIELCFFGAKRLHSKMFEPIMSLGIPIRIKNTLNPRSEGTLIAKNDVSSSVRAVCTLKGSATVTIRSSNTSHNISMQSLTMIPTLALSNTMLMMGKNHIKHKIAGEHNYIGMIATVGVDLLQSPELIHQVLKSLRENSVEVLAIFSIGTSTVLAVRNGFENQTANLIHNIIIGD